MKIIEYNKKYDEDIKDLLVELEEYIVSIDEDHLDVVSEDYREKMIITDLKNVNDNNGKVYLAILDKHVIGLIMGIIYKYNEEDNLDYKCPKKGIVTELIVTNQVRAKGIGNMLMNKMKEYFKNEGCEYISLEAFSYNNNAIDFYKRRGYHNRMNVMIHKI